MITIKMTKREIVAVLKKSGNFKTSNGKPVAKVTKTDLLDEFGSDPAKEDKETKKVVAPQVAALTSPVIPPRSELQDRISAVREEREKKAEQAIKEVEEMVAKLQAVNDGHPVPQVYVMDVPNVTVVEPEPKKEDKVLSPMELAEAALAAAKATPPKANGPTYKRSITKFVGVWGGRIQALLGCDTNKQEDGSFVFSLDELHSVIQLPPNKRGGPPSAYKYGTDWHPGYQTAGKAALFAGYRGSMATSKGITLSITLKPLSGDEQEALIEKYWTK